MVHIAALALSADHSFSKQIAHHITLHAGLGVVGDAHAGALVRHRSRVAKDPSQPNLRQVHLLDTGFIAYLADRGFAIAPGAMGENILVDGLALIDLPAGTQLAIGGTAGPLLTITGLRNPCHQLNALAPGLMAACLSRHDDGSVKRLAGVMAVVTIGGTVALGDAVAVALPPPPHRRLEPV